MRHETMPTELLSGPRVLVVDDDNKLAASLCRQLKRLPARPDVASTGDVAVDRLLDASENDPFKLIILDMWVPRSKHQAVDEGFGKYFLLDIQRAFGLVSDDTPIVVFTAHDSYEDCVECIRRGAVDYLPKTTPVRKRTQGETVEYPPTLEDRGVDNLIKRCKDLLTPLESATDHFADFLRTNGGELIGKLGGKYIALVPADVRAEQEEQNARFVPDEHIECVEFAGDLVVAGETWEEVRRLILSNAVTRWKDITITHVPLPEEL
jgi:CheY-like chemotaxis protein